MAARPVPTREALADDLLEKAESASFAFLLLLERLSPQQRAVLLHDVFDYSHDEALKTIGCTLAASRQTLGRARLKLGGVSSPTSPPTEKAHELVAHFFEATRSGNVEGLIGALAADVVLMSDGGGRVPAVKVPLAGRTRVGRFLGAVSQPGSWSRLVSTELNGQPAILAYEEDVLTNVSSDPKATCRHRGNVRRSVADEER